MGGGWGENVSESGFAGLLDAQDGETADYLTQRVGHYPDNRSILTFLILATRVERVPRPVRIALRDTKQGGQRLFTRHASRLFTLLLPNPQLRQPRHDLDRLQADADHLADEAHDVLRVVGAVGVVDDAAAFVGFEAVLVDHPFEGGAVAEAVGEGFGGNTVEDEEVVTCVPNIRPADPPGPSIPRLQENHR